MSARKYSVDQMDQLFACPVVEHPEIQKYIKWINCNKMNISKQLNPVIRRNEFTSHDPWILEKKSNIIYLQTRIKLSVMNYVQSKSSYPYLLLTKNTSYTTLKGISQTIQIMIKKVCYFYKILLIPWEMYTEE